LKVQDHADIQVSCSRRYRSRNSKRTRSIHRYR